MLVHGPCRVADLYMFMLLCKLACRERVALSAPTALAMNDSQCSAFGLVVLTASTVIPMAKIPGLLQKCAALAMKIIADCYARRPRKYDHGSYGSDFSQTDRTLAQ